MDPLSVTASVVAVLQAGGSIGKIVKTIKSLGNAPAEFLALLNELSVIQAVFEQVKSSLQQLQTSPTSATSDDLSIVKYLEQELAQISEDLKELAERFITGIRRRDRDGLPHISKANWYREKATITQLRQKAQDVQSQLALAFTVTNASQTATQTGLIFDIQNVFETQCTTIHQKLDHGIADLRLDQNMSQNTQNAIQSDIEFVKQRVQGIDAMTAELSNLKQMQETTHQNLEGLIGQLSRRIEAMKATSSENAEQHPQGNERVSQGHRSTGFSGLGQELETRATEALTRQPALSALIDISTSAVSIYGTVRQRCPPQCKCQCHKVSRMQTPAFLRSVIGVLCVQYNSIPFFDRRPCNSGLCRSNSRTLVGVRYQFPRWMVARAVCALMSSGGLTNRGASLHLKVSRVIEFGAVENAIVTNDIQWLQREISEKRLLMTDRSSTGVGPLCYALQLEQWDAISFLVHAGFDYTLQDADGYSSITYLRFRMALLDTSLFMRKLQTTFPQLLDLDEDYEPRTTTIIHDAIIGTTRTSLQEALELDPSEKNTLDYMGFSPLHWAVIKDNAEAVKYLLRFGAIVDVRSTTGVTPLAYAKLYSIASILIDSGADVNTRDSQGATPLHSLCNYYMIYDLITLLLRRGADPNAQTNDGSTPLHRMLPGNRWHPDPFSASVLALLEGGADLESTTHQGDTALLRAARYNPAASMRLIELGAQLKARDIYGQNLLFFVAIYWDQDDIDALRMAEICPIDTDPVDNMGDTPLNTLWYRIVAHLAGDNQVSRCKWPTFGTVWSFTALIVEIRERNWAAGLFLESMERVTADLSHQKMYMWLRKQQNRLQEDSGLIGRPWSISDSWWFDEELTLEEREWKWLDEDELDEQRASRLSPEDASLYSGLGELTDEEDETMEIFSDAQEYQEQPIVTA